jgi:hypothetical protein
VALELSICVKTYDADCSALYLQDKTGDYDQDGNQTGYGEPNFDYSSLKLLVRGVAKKMDYTTGVLYDVPLVISEVEIAGVSYYKAITVGDGNYVFTFRAYLRKGSVEEDTTKALWDESLQSFVRYIGEDYVPILETELTPADAVGVSVDAHRYFFVCNSNKCIAKKFAGIKKGCPCEAKKIIGEIDSLILLEVDFQNALYDYDALLYSRAQENIDRVIKACAGKCGKPGGCGCGCS